MKYPKSSGIKRKKKNKYNAVKQTYKGNSTSGESRVEESGVEVKYVDVIRKRYAKFIGKENTWEEETPITMK